MNRITSVLRQLVRDEAGQDLIEYALLGALISVTLVAILISVSTAVRDTFQSIIDAL